jgi:dihydroxy-acid dehydratase
MSDIDRLSRHVPCLCKLAPNTHEILGAGVQPSRRHTGILGELNKAGLIKTDVQARRCMTIGEAIDKYDITKAQVDPRPTVSTTVLPATALDEDG